MPETGSQLPQLLSSKKKKNEDEVDYKDADDESETDLQRRRHKRSTEPSDVKKPS